MTAPAAPGSKGGSIRDGSGVGRLREIITEAAEIANARRSGPGRKGLGCMTVLSSRNDPYRFDTPEGHLLGRWFADQVARFVPRGQTVHLRGLHYRLVAAGNVRKPLGIKGSQIQYGTRYINNNESWEWLVRQPANAARWLQYVPFDRIHDERNAEPENYADLAREIRKPSGGIYTGGAAAHLDIPKVGECLPFVYGEGFDTARQPYRIVLIGEKSSLAEVLEPIAREYQAELLLPTGEASTTMIREMAGRACDDGRPTVVLYHSDFDPSGWQMPVSVSRKLLAYRDLDLSGLQIEVHRVALTADQVRTLALPSTPLKPSELRAGHWREHWGGLEQTEIDALAALRPDELRRITRQALRPFFDLTLAHRQHEAGQEWHTDARQRLESHPGYAPAVAAIAEAHAAFAAALEAARDSFRQAHEQATTPLRRIRLPRIEAPEAQITIVSQPPLFWSEDDYATATRKLKADKALADEEDDT
jgi:hypothetical protein